MFSEVCGGGGGTGNTSVDKRNLKIAGNLSTYQQTNAALFK